MQTDIKEGYVKSELHQGIDIIEFFHPQSNSLPGVLLDELAKAIHRAGHDPNVKVIVLRSGGEKVFCAGASFEELIAIKNEEQGKRFFMGFANVINAMRKCPKFIIGLVQGKCVGGGVGIAASVDYCIATEQAEVKLSELAIGIGPFVVGPAVERKIGTSAFSQLAIDAAMWRNAEWARRKGLFAEVYSSMEEMEESVRKLALSLTHANPEAMAELKKVFWKGTEHWDSFLAERAAISGKLVLSEFTRNAIIQFKSNRK
jgi:methylglutaconyl-CoA hydratase